MESIRPKGCGRKYFYPDETNNWETFEDMYKFVANALGGNQGMYGGVGPLGTMQTFVAKVMFDVSEFRVRITLAVDPASPPSETDVVCHAYSIYGKAMADFVNSQGKSQLPSQVTYVSGPFPNPGYSRFQSKVASTSPPGFEDAAAEKTKSHLADIAKALDAEESTAFYPSRLPGEVPPETRVKKPWPTCETDKPEGKRDVDKFLKEQQDKMWKGK